MELKEEVKSDVSAAPAPNVNPADFAAKEFQMGIGPLKKALGHFSRKELIRIISFIIEHPLEEQEYKFQDKRSERLTQLANHLLVCKMLMMQEAFKPKGETNGEVIESGGTVAEQEG